MSIAQFWVVIPVVVTLLGVFALIAGTWVIIKARASAGWPSCQGIIASSRLKRARTTAGGETFEPAITFEYHIAGSKYSASRISSSQSLSSKLDRVLRTVAEYPTGKDVTVYYDPNNPKTAVLEPGVGPTSYFILVAGIFLTAIGVLLLCLAGPAFK